MKTKNWKITGSKVWSIAPMLAIAIVGCGGGGSSISVMPSLEEFQQHTNVNIKIDILFVIDDSGSMAKAQEELQNNFTNFIQEFSTKGYDFRIAVGRTSDWNRSSPNFFCGSGNNCSGSNTDHILNSDDPNIVSKFVSNANVGLAGHGSERALQSTKHLLDSQSHGTFPRSDSHFAVINIGDEGDGPNSSGYYTSNSQGSLTHGYFSTVQEYVDDLKARAAAGHSAHAIQVLGEPGCQGQGDNGGVNDGYYAGDAPSSPLHSVASRGDHQISLANIMNGMALSMCEPFANSLLDLGEYISSLATTFELTEQLDAQADGNLKVFVEGLNGNNPIPRSTTNGFEYDIGTNSITFYGSMVPPQGALIGLQYTCATFNCD